MKTTNSKWLISLFIGLLVSISLVSAQCPFCSMTGFGYSGMWGFGLVIWLLIIVALTLFIIWLLKQIQKK